MHEYPVCWGMFCNDSQLPSPPGYCKDFDEDNSDTETSLHVSNLPRPLSWSKRINHGDPMLVALTSVTIPPIPAPSLQAQAGSLSISCPESPQLLTGLWCHHSAAPRFLAPDNSWPTVTML
jgi:hypothetical protein